MINEFIYHLPNELQREYYNAFTVPMYITFALVLITFLHRTQFSKKEKLFVVLCFAAAYYLSPMVFLLLNSLTNGVIPTSNLGKGYLTFMLVFCIGAMLCKLPKLQALDAVLPSYIAGRGVCIIGCLFEGCCHGYYAEWGIYSHAAGTTTVPCPIIDTVLSLLLVIGLLIMNRRRWQNRTGTTAAWACIGFGAIRYIIDILRDNEKVIGMITFEGFCGCAMVIIGLIMLYVFEQKKENAIL